MLVGILFKEVFRFMRVLLIIDLQKQFADEGGNYQKCLQFVREHRVDYDATVATYFKQGVNNPNFRKHLNWNGCNRASEYDLEFYDEESWKGVIVPKSGYGSSALELILKQIKCGKDDQIDIIGCDADACVMAICFQLWDAGFTNMKILTDYIYTTADFGGDMWLKYMKRNFGDCVSKGDM